MKKLRLLLLPIGAVSELLLLVLCLGLALTSKKLAERVVDWARSTMPSLDWYMGSDTKTPQGF